MRSKWVTMMLVTAIAAATLCGCKKGGGEEKVTPGAQPTGTPTVTGTVELPFTTEEYNEAKMQVVFEIEITKDQDESLIFTNLMKTSINK